MHPVVSVRDCSLLSRLLRSPRLARSRRYTRYVLVLLPRPSILDPRPRTPRFDLVRPDPTRPDRAARSRARATLTTWCTQARLFSSLLSLRLHVRTRGSNVLTLLLSEGGRGRMIPLCATRRSLFPSLRPKITTPFLSLLFARHFHVFLGHISRSHSIRVLPRLFREGCGMRLGVRRPTSPSRQRSCTHAKRMRGRIGFPFLSLGFS